VLEVDNLTVVQRVENLAVWVMDLNYLEEQLLVLEEQLLVLEEQLFVLEEQLFVLEGAVVPLPPEQML
jgi:hypothetical protein